MKAIRIHGRGGPDHLFYEDVPQPHPGQGEVLVRVSATGVFVNELRWNETYETPAGSQRDLPIPGRDLSGVVVEVGPDVSGLPAGAEVYAMLGYVETAPRQNIPLLCPGNWLPNHARLMMCRQQRFRCPRLPAWQGLFEQASLVAGQTILIHGGAGGVGVFVVQLARLAGAHVIATTSGRNRDFLRELGADEFIDYTTMRFEAVVHDVDLVFDLVGGDTLQRSWQVIKPGGTLVSVRCQSPTLC